MDNLRLTAKIIPRQSQAGSHRTGSTSVSSLFSTLIPVFLFAAVLVYGFLFLRSKQRRVYTPRSYIPALRKDEQTPGSSKTGMLGWVGEFMHLPDEYVLNHQSLDQYLFLRFFKMITIMAFIGCCITWPILLPVNATGGGGQSGLDTISFSNVQNPNRYYAHVIVAWIYLGFIMVTITRETIYSINLREAYLLSPRHANLISAKTVLFTDVPESCLEELRSMFFNVERTWVSTNCDDLQDLIDDRSKAVAKLEKAEIKLSQDANKKRIKTGKKTQPHDNKPESEQAGSEDLQWLDKKKRPKHKLKLIFGKKVDTIDWARGEIPKLSYKIKDQQMKAHYEDKGKFIGAVFIEFNTQRAAQTAFQLTAHENPLKMQARCIDVPPEQIIWKNLKMKSWNRIIRGLLANAFVALMILFWSIPVAFVGILANVNYLTTEVPFLSFINNIPSQILGIITGLLPAVMLAILVILVPVICNKLAKLAGAVTLQEVELKTQSWYFMFQLIQVFLVTTLSSGATAVASQIVQNPMSAPTLLAKNLPKASNFYITYFILYGLAMSSKLLFNLVTLLKFNILGRLLDKTPRKMFTRYMTLSGLGWGKEYPKWTNLAVVAIAYSCIAPIVLGFATVGLALLYIAFRYNSFFTVTTTIDTHGQAYSRALQQLTAGVYLSELCLIGLFAINTGTSASSSGPLILMVLFLIGTVAYHYTMHKLLHPLTRTLPSSLFKHTDEFGTQKSLEAGQQMIHARGQHQNDLHVHSPSNSDPINVHNNIRYDHEASGFDANSNLSGEHGLNNLVSSSHSDHDRDENNHVIDDKHNISPTNEPTGHKIEKKGSLIARFLNPRKYAFYSILRTLLQSTVHNNAPVYTEKIKRNAYFNPAIRQKDPKVWIVKDPMGISAREIRDTNEVIVITDELTWLDEKNHIRWDTEHPQQVPIWDEFMEKVAI